MHDPVSLLFRIRMRTFLIALLFCPLLITPIQGNGAAIPPAPQADVLVIHDSLAGRIPSGVVVANNIIDLLGHFGLKGAMMSFEEYKANDVNRYRFVFVLGVDDRKVACPAQLLSDVRSTSVPVFWVLNNLD